MCVTTANAQLTETIIGVWEIDHPTKGHQHVLAYQNSPQNLSKAGNCMLLHIPTKDVLRPDCIMDTTLCPDFLKSMKKQLTPIARNFSGDKEDNYIVKMGIYHIALLNQVDEDTLDEILSEIPKTKRPDIAPGFLSFYQKHFPGLPLVLCCFDNRESALASPIMLHYAPMYPDYFIFPTLESHGTIPDFEEKVKFHQTIMAGTQQEISKLPSFHYEGKHTALSDFYPKRGIGTHLNDYRRNGDVCIPREKLLNEGLLQPLFSQGIS